MVGGAIALNPYEVAIRVAWIDHRQIDKEARHAHLGMAIVSEVPNGEGDSLLEVAVEAPLRVFGHRCEAILRKLQKGLQRPHAWLSDTVKLDVYASGEDRGDGGSAALIRRRG